MKKVIAKDIFISHSSENVIIAEQLGAFIRNLGVSNERIFCSSVLGQGVNNGEKLNDAVFSALKNAKIIIYILSQDFLSSNYCIEELGAGWYLSTNKQTCCYYMRLPDMELSELHGFINSKIDKFSLLNDSSDLTLFVENICNKLRITIPKLSEIENNKKSFLSSIKEECIKSVEKKVETEKLENERQQKVTKLEKELLNKDDSISELRMILKKEQERNDEEKLNFELEFIGRYIGTLGTVCIRSSAIKNIYKDFWFNIINRYEGILDELGITPDNLNTIIYSYSMESLIAQIYITYGDFTNGYKHFKYAIQNSDEYVPFGRIENFVEIYPYSLSEIIVLLKEIMQKDRDGVGKDLTFDCIQQLEQREAKITAELSK